MSSLSFPTEFMNTKRPIFDNEIKKNHEGPEIQESEGDNYSHQIIKSSCTSTKNFLKVVKHVNRFARQLLKKTEQKRFHNLSKNQFTLINDVSSSYNYYVESGRIEGRISSYYKATQFVQAWRNQNLISIPVLMPDQFIVVLMNFIILTTLFFQILYLPIIIAFSTELENNSFVLIDSYVVYIFIFEILVNLNTAYYSKGQIQGSRQSILVENAKKNLIFNVIVIICSFHHTDLNFFEIIRLLKIYQITTLVEYFEEMYFLRQRFSSLLDIIRLIVLLVVIAHICSCAWYYLTKNERGWLVKAGIEDSSANVKYINSLYWVSITFLTVGYGDISPITENEKIIGTVLAYLTCGVFGYAINKIGTIISDQNIKEQHIKQQMALINQFMKQRNISQSLKLKITNYFLYSFKNEERKQQLQQIDQILSKLEPQIKTDLNKELYLSALQKSQYFQLSSQTLLEIVTCVEEELFSPDQIILESQSVSEKLYFVINKNGEFDIKNNKIKQNENLIFLNEEEFFSQSPTLFQIKSKNFLQIASLKYSSLINIIRKNKVDHEKFRLLIDNYRFCSGIQRCRICQTAEHSTLQCKYIFYIPNRQRILNKYFQTEDQSRQKQFSRFKLKGFNFKFNQMSLKAEAINCCLQNGVLQEQEIDVNFLTKVGLERDNASLTGQYTLNQIRNGEKGLSVLLIKQDQGDSSSDEDKDLQAQNHRHRQSRFHKQTLVNFNLADTEKIQSRLSLGHKMRESHYKVETYHNKEQNDFECAQNYLIYYPNFNLSRILKILQAVFQQKKDELKQQHPLKAMKNKWLSNRSLMTKK